MVNHACNLRCSYCYTGDKMHRPLPGEYGRHAIRRAVASLEPGGTLELGFFGGEPLIEAERILEWITFAEEATAAHGTQLQMTMTTNGTFDSAAARGVMTHPRLALFVSHDGLPEIHDRHRVSVIGEGTAAQVERTLRWLIAGEHDFSVNMVVRPDTVAHLPDGIRWLQSLGVRHFSNSLDLWTNWSHDDMTRLREAIFECVAVWRASLPECSISWFDEQVARYLSLPQSETARCGFGHGELAVSPAGNLYPCERLIGADAPNNRWRLAGHVLDGEDFRLPPPAAALPILMSTDESCATTSVCGESCRCSNFVRTGDASRPDLLLTQLATWCAQAARSVVH